MTLRSCSAPFLVVGLVGFFRVLLGKDCFWLVCLINFFNGPQTRLKHLNRSLCKNYSQELPCWNHKQLENFSIEEHQLCEPKLVTVEMSDLNKT